MSGASVAVAIDSAAVEQAWLGMNVLAVDVMLALSGLTLMLGDLVLPHGNKRILGWTALAQLILCLTATFFLPLEGAALSEKREHGTLLGFQNALDVCVFHTLIAKNIDLAHLDFSALLDVEDDAHAIVCE